MKNKKVKYWSIEWQQNNFTKELKPSLKYYILDGQ